MKFNHSNNLEDLLEFVSHHKLNIGIVALLGFAAVQLMTGGGDALKQKFTRDAQDSTAAEMQARAEGIFQSQGCSAQVLNGSTGKPGLTEGATAIDPATKTAFPSGSYVCSPNGGLWQVTQSGTVHLIGTSPNIRKQLIETGAIAATDEMTKVYSH